MSDSFSTTRPIGSHRFAAVLMVVMFLANTARAWAGETGVPQAESGMLEAVFFYVFAAGALFSGLMICAGKNVIRMAVWLFFVLGSVAMLYFLLGANFLAVIQFIVYAGGILILLIFGVMLTNRSPWVRLDIKPREVAIAAAVGLVLMVTLVGMITVTDWPEEMAVADGLTVAEIGRGLLTTYLVPFEVVSVLLLVVMIGAAYLARQES
ncbi:MAG: NADH-quinone oxidoreductase subunit J [Phycisphaerae bacterium]|nr:NADH-quinone oxidoreductase subunit J [Phycisphaerae bacterium]